MLVITELRYHIVTNTACNQNPGSALAPLDFWLVPLWGVLYFQPRANHNCDMLMQ